MSAAPRPESAAAAAIDLERVGVAAAVLDYSHAADRLARLAEPTDALDDPWLVQELAATVIVIDLNQLAAAALGAEPEALRSGHLFPLIEMTSGMLDSFKAQFHQIVDGSLTSRTELRSADGNKLTLVDWRSADESYRRVVLTLRDISATRIAAERWTRVSVQMHRLGEATSTIARRLDDAEVRREAVSRVCHVLECDQAALLMVDPDRPAIEDVVRIDHTGGAPLPEPTWEEFRSSIGGQALETGATSVINDVTAGDLCGTGSAIATPLVADQQVGVVIGMRKGAGRPFTDADVAAIELLAAAAARSMENARTYEWISEESAALAEAKGEIKSASDHLATAQAQKLEAIGELAAGITHEINTPIQFIGDNAQFLAEVAPAIADFHRKALELADAASGFPELEGLGAAVLGAADIADLSFTDSEASDALAQIRGGVGRVAQIVRPMNDFAHKGGDSKTPIDLNATVETTVAVARNEWKYHSEIALDLDDGLPLVPALADPLEQAILVIIINAAQAIEDAVGDSGHKGTIAISTSQRGDMAQIKITDSGGGIAPEIQNRIFDPFFTTREVGRGSGQGLTICRTAIVDQHGGTLEFETEPGVGTTFIASLPLHMEEDYA